ncbi:MAG: zinc ribbon domain-containing protein [Blastocatellia bacterium]
MQEATCNRCGASIVLSAKFCRQCGNRLDVSELTTRTLEEPGADHQPFEHPTRPANAGITSPTYPPPAMIQPPPHTPVIGSAPPTSNKTALLVILGAVMAMLIGLGVVAFLVLNRQSALPVPPPPPPHPGQTERGTPPPPPGITPPPPPAVQTSLDPSLIYPGAKVVMDIGSEDARVTHLQTTDDIEKVVAWYVERVKPKNDVKIPGGRIISAEGINLLFNSTGDGTTIMVTREGNGKQ